jgi:5-methylcytosine-specific restriction endonuclease McrA
MPSGFCECGCGGTTKIADHSDRSKGWVRGVPLRFIDGHRFANRPRRQTPEEKRRWFKEWEKRNASKRKAQRRLRYLVNRTAVLEYCKTYRVKFPERRRSVCRNWYQANKHKTAEYNRARRVRLLNASGSHSTEQWMALCLAYDFHCLRCHRREPEIKLSRDHIIPLSKHGSDDIDNIQPLCLKCNKWKTDRAIDYRFTPQTHKLIQTILRSQNSPQVSFDTPKLLRQSSGPHPEQMQLRL